MRRGRTLILVFLIIIIALAVGFVFVSQILNPPAEEVVPVFAEVYIAAQNIPQGGEITEAVLTTITVPQDKVIAVMYTRDKLGALNPARNDCHVDSDQPTCAFRLCDQ